MVNVKEDAITVKVDADDATESIDQLCKDVKDLNAELEYTSDLLEEISQKQL